MGSDKYKIAVIGDTSSGKTMLLLGLIMTSKKGLTVVSEDHQEDVNEMRKYLQKGVTPDGTKRLTAYNLSLQRTGLWGSKAAAYPLVFRDYKGGDIKDGISFFDQKFGDCDGVLFLMNPGQPVLNLGKTEDADDATLSMLTNLINGISGCSGDRKCRATAMAAAVTAMDRIRKGGDLYAHRSKFFDAFNRYIVNPLKTNASGIACKTDFKISVTEHVESQEKINRIYPRNNAAAPFLWLIDRIDRRKHPIRYWTRRLWLVLLLGALAVFGCLTWWWQHSWVDEINEKGEYAFKRAQTEFCSATTIASYREYVGNLSNCVSNLERRESFFPDAKEKKNVAYTNLLAKYLLMEADAAFLKMKESVNDKQKPDADKAYALRITNLKIDTPKVFDHYTAQGFTQEVANAANRLAEHRENKVPEVVSEYNEQYFKARFDKLETNAGQEASEENIRRLQKELDAWKLDCSSIASLSNIIVDVSKWFDCNKSAWRDQYATNVVKKIWEPDFKGSVQERPNEIFEFGKKKIGTQLQERLKKKEPQAQENLEQAKKVMLQDCRMFYFGQKQFSSKAEQYPQDDKLRGNLDRLLQDTTLTNSVSEWRSELHDKQRLWLRAEIERVQDKVSSATDQSDFFMRPRKGTGDKVHSLLANCRKWADEETDDKKKTIFDNDCKKVWEQFIARYFSENKWTFGDNYEYPIAEDNLKDKIRSFLGSTRITDVTVETDNWLSKMREMQKKWLIDAMEECQKFPDGFDAFKDDGSGEDIKKVLIAAESFINDSLGENEGQLRVDKVKEERQKLIGAMEEKYFKDKKFAPSHEFGLKDGDRWFDVYQSANEELQKGFEMIFVPETGDDINIVTNEWMCALWSHEQEWLIASKHMCTNEAAKFLASKGSNAIVDFVTSHSGNPFLWRYVTGVKTTTKDFGLEQFKDRLMNYVDGNSGVELCELKNQFKRLHQNASTLSKNASTIKYAGLYDIFALRHLCTNGTPVRVISTRSSANGNEDRKTKAQEMVQGVKNAVLDGNWLPSQYKINGVKISLFHPGGVVAYTTDGRNVMDIFKMTVEKGEVGDNVFLPARNEFSIGKAYQAPNPWVVQVVLDGPLDLDLDLFASIKFKGSYGEEYIRRGADPKPVKDSPWNVEISVPHLKTVRGMVASSTIIYSSFANKGPKDSPQNAELTVSVDGEFVGPTPYERIDACIEKAREMESDDSNVWLTRCREAEERLEELNRILPEDGASDAGGQF